MQNLRLVGIHEDGQHVLLSDDDGGRFQVPLDDALRAAVRRERPRPAGDRSDAEHEPMRPREVQALIRTGVPLEEVAERSGWDLDKVRRYEPPIRAERDYVAAQARALEVRDRTGAATLGERVALRLTDRGVDSERVSWDAWKETDATWKVVCLFPAGGRERRASWRFTAADRAVIPTDDEARWLGEDEHGTAPGAPAPLAAKSSRNAAVYDVEAEGGVAAKVRARSGTSRPTSPTVSEKSDSAEQGAVDMVSVMRERAASRRRKPQRRPSPTDTPIPSEGMPDEARPVTDLDLSDVEEPPQASHAAPDDLTPESSDVEAGDTDAVDSADADEAPRHDPVTGTRDLFEDLEEVSESKAHKASRQRGRGRNRRTTSSEPEKDQAQARDAEPVDVPVEVPDEEPDDAVEPPAEPDASPEVPDRQRSTRKGRPSVPSWDDIMFGSRRED
ncbi:septation protein SepH [Demetria terragena]|uniref:septation protein SepH n=1 Tax=Demetria terragena TaxID=63959 RepID=UPI00037F105E|nr:septation protein SepH [Demetria terragena]